MRLSIDVFGGFSFFFLVDLKVRKRPGVSLGRLFSLQNRSQAIEDGLRNREETTMNGDDHHDEVSVIAAQQAVRRERDERAEEGEAADGSDVRRTID